MGILALVGEWENKEEIFGWLKKWVGRIVDKEREIEAAANGGEMDWEGTMASCCCLLCSSAVDSWDFGVWRLGSIGVLEEIELGISRSVWFWLAWLEPAVRRIHLCS